MAKKSSAVAKRPSAAVAVVHDYGKDAGRGVKIEITDLLIPFLDLLQSDTKECIPDEQKYVKGAEAGMLINKATKELRPGIPGLLLVPVQKKRSFVEWLPDRGGFVAEHSPESEIVQNASGRNKDMKAANGNSLVETFSIFAIILDEETEEPLGYVVVPFTSSKIKVWRGYWTGFNQVRVQTDDGMKTLDKIAPLFAHRIRLSVFDDKNVKGQRYKNYTMKPAISDGDSDPNIIESMIGPEHLAYKAGDLLSSAIEDGRAQADFSTATDERGSGETRDERF